MSRVLLGVTGGIAAYKACELCRLLVKEGHDVVPLVTPGAERFVTAETFRALARRPPGDDVYLHLTRADLLVVAPCTANTLAKLAHGLADNVLTEAALAHRGPVLAAPAMNPRMWSHPATRANAEALRERGVVLVGPDEGETAEGELGVGRMAEPDEILAAVRSLLMGNGALRGKRVLVSAGGTREPLDAVRYVGNRSSGRMGVALAAEARRRGAEVTLLAANLAVPSPTTARPRRWRRRGRRTPPRGRSSWSRRPTCCRRSASAAATASSSSASRPRPEPPASSARARSSRARAPTFSS
jgi:phosphopantothenoylcysteine decarboxylase/phosphopantothenate--cysteine ligase